MLAWAVREATTNVVRHSGARACAITSRTDARRVSLEVDDDGAAADTGVAATGQRPGGLAERVRAPGTARSRRALGPAAASALRLTLAAGGDMIRVLIAEDQAMVRGALAACSRSKTTSRSSPRSAAATRCCAAAARRAPDVALLDIEMPGCDGIAAAAALARELPACRVADPDDLRPARLPAPGDRERRRRLPAQGRPGRASWPPRSAGVAGERVVDPALAAAALSEGDSPLTERERDVLAAAATHATAAEIGRAASLSEGTVRNYLSAAIQKLGARNRAEAIDIAGERGWL